MSDLVPCPLCPAGDPGRQNTRGDIGASAPAHGDTPITKTAFVQARPCPYCNDARLYLEISLDPGGVRISISELLLHPDTNMF
jgi:hypothetical protein